jgi:hypothetical protein
MIGVFISLHHHNFLMLLWDAPLRTGYGEEVPEYHGQLYIEHNLPLYEVHMDIPSHPVFPNRSPWLTWVIRNDMNNTLERVAHHYRKIVNLRGPKPS